MGARTGAVSAITATLVVLGACGDSESGSGAPAGATPFVGVDGGELYAAACAVCHGADLNGAASGPPLLHDFYRPGHHSDAAILLAVRRGVRKHHWGFGNMAPVPGLSDEQVEAITRFIRSEQRAVGIE